MKVLFNKFGLRQVIYKLKQNLILWLILSAICGFGIGYIHHFWIFPIYFHGDAAAMHVLAKAILQDHTLLPTDFSYGNQIIFLRSAPFIALSTLIGFTDLAAFGIGSAISISLWSIILFLILNEFFNEKKKAIVFAIILLIPLGPMDSNYILGQQSHLANAILALGIAIYFYRYIETETKPYLVLSSLMLCIITVEAPIRGLMIIFPVYICGVAISKFEKSLTSLLYFSAAISSAILLNIVMIRSHPIAINYFSILTFKSSDDIITNLIFTSKEFISEISSLNIVTGEQLSVFSGMVFTASIILLILQFGFIVSGGLKLLSIFNVKNLETRSIDRLLGVDEKIFISMVASLGIAIGALVVSSLNPDSYRHYIWAIFLLKFFTLLSVNSIITEFITRRYAWLFLIFITLLCSIWFATSIKFGAELESEIRKTRTNPILEKIRNIAEKTEIQNIYGGDFYKMATLNSTIQNLNAQVLILRDGKISPYLWLTKPSQFCVRGDVLYYLKDDPVDIQIRNMFISSGRNPVIQEDGFSLWIAPPVWDHFEGSLCQ